MLYYLIVLLVFLSGQLYGASSCIEAFKTADYNQALLLCEKDLARQTNQGSAEILVRLIDISSELDLKEKQQYYLNQLKNDKDFEKLPKYRYFWNRKQGINYFYNGEIDIANDYFNEALSLAVINQDLKWIAKSFNDLGMQANKKKDFKKALEYYGKSLDIRIQVNDFYMVGKLYNNIGAVYMLLEDYQQAISYYKLALDSYNKYQETKNYNNKVLKDVRHANESLLELYLIITDYEMANNYAQKIINNTAEQLITREKIPLMLKFVRVYIQEGQYELADYFLKESLLLSQQANNYFLSEIKYQFAKLYQKQGLIDKAIEQADSGIVALDNNDYVDTAKFYLFLSELNEGRDTKKSLAFLKEYQSYREKLLKQEYRQGIRAIQHVIEKEQIEHELNLERLELVSKDLKIKSLSNKFLLVSIVLIILTTALVVFYVSKRREKNYLLAKIGHHKQQLVMLNDKSSNEMPLDSIDESITREIFCKHLVATMSDAVNIWEKYTNTNRIELADLSGIWTVSNDDGSLRTRSLDKYLSIDKIPKNPRWRNVVRTCHFILTDEKISKSARERLEKNLSKILMLFQNLSSQSNSEIK